MLTIFEVNNLNPLIKKACIICTLIHGDEILRIYDDKLTWKENNKGTINLTCGTCKKTGTQKNQEEGI